MKQNKPLVSVVVPVYNSENFLAECLDSIVEQVYKNIEIILVNDGSTDSSGELCNNYATQDARIKVVHQKNRGVSAARNTGIDASSGTYVAFVDSDDTIHQNYIQYLLDDAVRYAADIVTTSVVGATSRQKNTLSSPVRDDSIIVLGVDDTLRELYKGTLEGTRNGMQLLSLELLNSNNIRYDESMAVGEDFDFFARAILASNKVAVDKRKMYFYRPNPTSAMQQSFSLKHFEAIQNVEGVGRLVEGRIPGLKKAIDTMVFSDAIFYGAKMVSVRNEWPNEYQKVIQLIKEHRLMVLVNNEAKKNTRIKALLTLALGANLGLVVIRSLIRW